MAPNTRARIPSSLMGVTNRKLGRFCFGTASRSQAKRFVHGRVLRWVCVAGFGRAPALLLVLLLADPHLLLLLSRDHPSLQAYIGQVSDAARGQLNKRLILLALPSAVVANFQKKFWLGFEWVGVSPLRGRETLRETNVRRNFFARRRSVKPMRETPRRSRRGLTGCDERACPVSCGPALAGRCTGFLRHRRLRVACPVVTMVVVIALALNARRCRMLVVKAEPRKQSDSNPPRS
jgi:hypothetical protein